MPCLYMVATPIGNLEDITLRALRILREVALIAAEDTRVTRVLLQRYEIKTPMTSYHEHNKVSKLPSLLATLQDKDVALVSDAGMPGINDPGFELVCATVKAGVPIVPIPGASAIPTALAISGLPIDNWRFLGFLPRKRSDKQKLLKSIVTEHSTLIFFDAPHRLRSSLSEILNIMGDRQITVCRELTKFHEEIFRGLVSHALRHFDSPRGEFTIVLAGSPNIKYTNFQDDVSASKLIIKLLKDGAKAREVTTEVAQQFEISRSKAYRLWLSVIRETKQTDSTK